MRKTTRFRELLEAGMVTAAGCFDPFSARLAQIAGFEALHMTGFGVEATQLGAPDLGLLSMSEITAHAARMADAVDVPIIADIDTGFGGVLNVQRTIREMERAGVAGVHIEDQALPKHCPLVSGRSVVPRGEAVDRLKAALDARADPDFVIVARTDADTVSFQELVDRCSLFTEVGADLVMPITLDLDGVSMSSRSPQDQMATHRRVNAAIGGRVMGNGSGPPPGYSLEDMAEAGFSLLIFAAGALSAAANAMAGYYRAILEERSDNGYRAAHPGPYNDPLNLLKAARLDDYVAAEARNTGFLNRDADQ
jgi:methylisocitrate lyase